MKVTKTITILIASALLLFACDSKPNAPKTDNHAHEQHEIKTNTPKADNHAHDHQNHQKSDKPMTLEDLPEGTNIVQYEMQLLTKAMQDILLHIANADLAKIPAEISKVHPIYELTHQALEQGIYNPPANSENVAGFASRDDAFHEDLFTLLTAARAKDLPAATTAYAKLIEGCTGCHTEFRFAQQ